MQWKITRISLLISSNGIQFQDDTSSTFRGVIAGDPCPHHQLTVLRRSYFHNKYSLANSNSEQDGKYTPKMDEYKRISLKMRGELLSQNSDDKFLREYPVKSMSVKVW